MNAVQVPASFTATSLLVPKEHYNIAKLGNAGMISTFVLGKTGNNQQTLGLVQSSVALGLLVGSIAITLLKPARDVVIKEAYPLLHSNYVRNTCKYFIYII